jgi:hypothetical protein
MSRLSRAKALLRQRLAARAVGVERESEHQAVRINWKSN